LACSVAGLTRPTAAGLVLAVLVAVVLDARRAGTVSMPHILAVVLAPVGLVISLGHVAVVTGRLDGWFWLEHTVWHSGFDGGWSLLRTAAEIVTGGSALHQPPKVMSVVVVLAFVVAFVGWVRRRPPTADVAYAATSGVLAIGERNFAYVKPRFLLVAFPVLVPAARRLAACSTATLVALALPALAGSLAWNTYLVVVWPTAL